MCLVGSYRTRVQFSAVPQALEIVIGGIMLPPKLTDNEIDLLVEESFDPKIKRHHPHAPALFSIQSDVWQKFEEFDDPAKYQSGAEANWPVPFESQEIDDWLDSSD